MSGTNWCPHCQEYTITLYPGQGFFCCHDCGRVNGQIKVSNNEATSNEEDDVNETNDGRVPDCKAPRSKTLRKASKKTLLPKKNHPKKMRKRSSLTFWSSSGASPVSDSPSSLGNASDGNCRR